MSGENIFAGMSALCLHEMCSSCSGDSCNCKCHYDDNNAYRSIAAEYRALYHGDCIIHSIYGDCRCPTCKRYDALEGK
jgi:hypothetical protein